MFQEKRPAKPLSAIRYGELHKQHFSSTAYQAGHMKSLQWLKKKPFPKRARRFKKIFIKHFKNMLNNLLIVLIQGYRKIFSPQTGALRFLYFTPIITFHPGGTGCIFEKTCSLYALEQYKTRPFKEATLSTLTRLSQCHR